jgi:hypothetical protein
MAWVARAPNVEDPYLPHPWLLWCGGAIGVWNTAPWKGKMDPITIATRVCLGTNGTQAIHDGNFGAFDMDVSTGNDVTTTGQYALPPSLFGKPADFFKGGLIACNNFYWCDMGEITGSSSPGAGRTVFNAVGWNSMTSDGSGPGYVSYVLGLLDSPNEWYKQDSTVYLLAPDGGDPSHHIVEARHRELGFDIRGKQYVNVTGIKFLAASMTLEDASNCIIDNCQFKYIAHNDIWDWYECGAGYYNSPYDPSDGKYGVFVSGHDNLVRKCLFAVSASSGIIISGKNNTVTNCIARDCDYTVTYHAGIHVVRRYLWDPEEARSIVISHNTLMYNSKANLQVAQASTPESPSQRIRIEYNDFGPSHFTLKENGSLSLQASREVEISHNWFHGMSGLSNVDIAPEYDFGGRAEIIHHNVFWQGPAATDAYKVGGHWFMDFNDTGAAGAKCFNNTVVDSCDVSHADVDTGWPPFIQNGGLGKCAFNNIYARGDTVRWMFTDARNRDYSLRAGSPAIDAGKVLPGMTTTFQGSAPDLGAYEYGEPRWTAGADWQEQAWVYPPADASVNGPAFPKPSLAGRLSLRVLPGRMVIDTRESAAWTARIYDARGSCVASHTQARGAAMPTHLLPAGIYAVRIASADKSAVWKANLR